MDNITKDNTKYQSLEKRVKDFCEIILTTECGKQYDLNSMSAEEALDAVQVKLEHDRKDVSTHIVIMLKQLEERRKKIEELEKTVKEMNHNGERHIRRSE